MTGWPSCRVGLCLIVLMAMLRTGVSAQKMTFSTNPFQEWVDDLADRMFPDHPVAANSTMGNKRGKRLLRKDPSLHWPQGIVPYYFSEKLRNEYSSEIKDILWVMSVYEYYTPIRFLPLEETRNLTLGHDGYAFFLANEEVQGCYSEVGNQRNKDGQFINCCERAICVHQIGHLLGFDHEQEHPNRDMWIRLNWEVLQGSYTAKMIKLAWEPYNHTTYDLSSYMHYPQEVSWLGHLPTYSIMFPELKAIHRHFYMFKELCDVYNCQAFPQCKLRQNLRCENEGYVSVVGNVCLCVCPPGLDQYKRCASVIQRDLTSYGMPRGRYDLLKLGDKCPDGPFVKGTLHVNGARLSICSRNRRDCRAGSHCGWPLGTYCIIQHGNCPAGRGMSQATLAFTRASTRKINFCCFEDGFPEDPVRFYNSQPFTLFMKHSKECQQVYGMRATKRIIRFYNTILTGDGPYSEGNDYERRVYVCDYMPVDMKCGNIIELNDTNPTVTIKSDKVKRSYRDCFWLIKGADKNGTLLLNFNKFNVKYEPTECIDSVEVRHSRIGQVGIKYCGSKVKHSIRSIFNKMMIRFQTGANSPSHFKATITWKPNKDFCYNTEDRGASYGGMVNYTRRFKPCVNWKDVAHCRYNPFEGGHALNTLQKNYCRNLDGSFQPWCYTEIKSCERDFCDVCHLERPYDNANKCDHNDCSKDPADVVSKCAASCQITKKDSTPKVSETTCLNPGPITDGLLQNSKSVYNVGETVTYKCNRQNSNHTIVRICLSSGKWSIANTACTECPLGFGAYKGNCYRYYKTKLTYNQAKDVCLSTGSYLATVKSLDENQFVLSLRYSDYQWLGGYYSQKKKAFVWEDGTIIDWLHFSLAPPKNITKPSDMHFTLAYWDGWQRFDKNERHTFSCKQKSLGNPSCVDYVNDCHDLLQNTAGINCNSNTKKDNLSPNLRNICRFSCGNCVSGCGGTFELNEQNTMKTFEAGSAHTACHWTFKAPLNKGALVLHFDKFDIESKDDKCVDNVEIRIGNIGKVAPENCGKEFKESIITTDNTMMVLYTAQANSKSNFKATVKYIPESEWCYRLDDKGLTYGGNVSHTQNYKACISWDLASKCPHNPYRPADLMHNLDGNYCRNPDKSPVPWCYTDVDTCKRESCDVCHWANPYDHSPLCKKRGPGYCTQIPETAIEDCAATCYNEGPPIWWDDYFCIPQRTERLVNFSDEVFEVTCDPPPKNGSRGPMKGLAKASYNVGDEIIFQCPGSKMSVEEHICLTSGQWAVNYTECADCPQGHAVLKDKCYNLADKVDGYAFAEEHCSKTDRKVAFPKSDEENTFLSLIRVHGEPLWLGGNRSYTKGWKWNDKTPFIYTNWVAGGIVNDRLYNCLYMRAYDGLWQSTRCYHSLHFICEKNKTSNFQEHNQPMDILDSCPIHLPQKNMCPMYPHLANVCPDTCSDYESWDML